MTEGRRFWVVLLLVLAGGLAGCAGTHYYGGVSYGYSPYGYRGYPYYTPYPYYSWGLYRGYRPYYYPYYRPWPRPHFRPYGGWRGGPGHRGRR